MSNQLVVFRLGQEYFGLPVHQVAVVLPRASLTRLPGAPAELIGMLRLRGALVPVVDIRLHLGLTTTAPQIGDCIVVMRTTTSRVGLLVEAIEGVVTLTTPNAPERASDPENNRMVRRVVEASGRVVASLDADTVLGSEVNAYLAAFAQRSEELTAA